MSSRFVAVGITRITAQRLSATYQQVGFFHSSSGVHQLFITLTFLRRPSNIIDKAYWIDCWYQAATRGPHCETQRESYSRDHEVYSGQDLARLQEQREYSRNSFPNLLSSHEPVARSLDHQNVEGIQGSDEDSKHCIHRYPIVLASELRHVHFHLRHSPRVVISSVASSPEFNFTKNTFDYFAKASSIISVAKELVLRRCDDYLVRIVSHCPFSTPHPLTALMASGVEYYLLNNQSNRLPKSHKIIFITYKHHFAFVSLIIVITSPSPWMKIVKRVIVSLCDYICSFLETFTKRSWRSILLSLRVLKIFLKFRKRFYLVCCCEKLIFFIFQ